MCVCGCANMCVSKLVFSFNCETAFLLISWCRGALIHFKETFLTVTLTLMTSLEWMLFTSVLLHLKIHSVWFGSILWQNVFICGYKSSCVFLFFFFILTLLQRERSSACSACFLQSPGSTGRSRPLPINPTHRTFTILWVVQIIYRTMQEQGKILHNKSHEMNHDSSTAWQWKHFTVCELCELDDELLHANSNTDCWLFLSICPHLD